MKSTFTNKLLLAGTALVAVGAFSAQAQAVDLTGASEYGTTAPVNAPTAGIDINLNSENLTINNTSNVTIGAITDTGTTPDGNVIIVTDAAADLTQTIGSVMTGTGNVTINNSANDGDVAVTVTGALASGGTLVVDGSDNTTADVVTLTVGGNTTVTGVTDITGGAAGAGNATTTVNIDGAANTFTGLVTVTGGAGAATNTANLVLSGAANTFTGGLTLTDGVANANLTLDGAVAQTVTGTVAGDGHITVANAAGASFVGTVTADTIVIEQAAANAAATFTNTVNVTSITLGAAGTDTNTVTFDTTTQAFTVTGTVVGAIAGETNAIVVSGDDILTQASAWGAGGNIDTVTVSGTATLNSDAAITATTLTIGSGAKLDQGAGLITAAIANSGTIQFTAGSAGVTGDITGSGTLDVDANTTLTGNVAGTSADVATGTALTIAGANTYSVSTTTLNGANGALVVGGAAQTISGNVVAAADGEGDVTVSNGAFTTTITGNIGTSTAKIDTFTAGGGLGNTITTTGDLHATTITGDDASTVQFLGTSAQAVSGAWTDGIITVGDATTTSDVTFNGVLASIASATTSANATSRFGANATVDGAYTNTGTTHVASGATLTADSLTDTGTYVLAVNDANRTLVAGDFGQLADSGANGTLTAAGSSLQINVQSQLGTGTVQLLTGINAGAQTLVDNSLQYSFVTADNAANTDVTVSKASLASLATNGSTTGVAATLDGLADSTDTEIAAINNRLAAASTSEQLNDILSSVAPTADAGAVVAATSFITSTTNITKTELASLRDGTESTGMFAGNVTNGVRAWGQVFGSTADQDARDGIAGYEADGYGVAMGLDTESLADNWIFGLGFAYADTEVDSKNVNSTNTEIDSYQVSLYGSYDLDDRTYVSGQVGYVWGDNDQTRTNVGGAGTAGTANSSYDSDTYFAGLEAGRKYMVGGNTLLTPKVLMNYQHYDADGYTETGAGGANLTVNSDSLDLLEVGVGVDASWDMQQASGAYLQPKIGVGVRHDLIGDEYESTSTFAAGGAAFNTKGFDPAQTTFNVSADLTYFSTTNWELSAGYDFEVKSDYDSHAGTMRAAYKF